MMSDLDSSLTIHVHFFVNVHFKIYIYIYFKSNMFFVIGLQTMQVYYFIRPTRIKKKTCKKAVGKVPHSWIALHIPKTLVHEALSYL